MDLPEKTGKSDFEKKMNTMKRHIQHAHTTSEEKKFRCDTCGKGFLWPQSKLSSCSKTQRSERRTEGETDNPLLIALSESIS